VRPSLQLVAAGCFLALVLTGCASDAPRAELIPPGPAVTSVEQLSGDYCYFGPEYNLRSFRRSPKMIPFVNVETFGEPTKVSVEASEEQIVFTFTDGDGNAIRHVFEPSLFRAAWRENALVVRWSGVGPSVGAMIGLNVLGNALGIVVAGLLGGSYDPDLYLGRKGRESRLFRLEDGRLVMTDTFEVSGDLKPADQSPGYWKRQDSVALLLDPVAGDCAAGPTHPPQAWYEEGTDLRSADCASRLEEEVVAILVAKKEAPDEARRAAGESVAALATEGRGRVNLTVPCPSGATYIFRFGRKESGCVIRLIERRTKHGGTRWSPGTMERPLPGCDCN